MKLKKIDIDILRLAIPSIISNITVPLLGLVDLAIAGHMGADYFIGAIAVGTMMFNVMYWLMGFLRMGCSGLTAQAFGGGADTVPVFRQFFRIALTISLLLLVLQYPLCRLFELLFFPTGANEVMRQYVCTYFYIVVWGAPAVLCQYVLSGWFIGMQNTKIPMWVSLLQNVVNISCSLLFVYVFGMKIAGIATGTVVAQWFGAILAFMLMPRVKGRLPFRREGSPTTDMTVGLHRILTLNGSLFLRTACLVAVNLFFTAAGSWQGALMLSVNTLMMTLFTIYSYFVDGFAYAGEALCGKYAGANRQDELKHTVRHLVTWGAAVAAIFTCAYVCGGQFFMSLLTSEADVVVAAKNFLPWTWLIPFAGTLAFIYDGVFVGLAAGRQMMVTMVCATAAFFGLSWGLWATIGNHALWLALICYLLLRGLLLHGLFHKGSWF